MSIKDVLNEVDVNGEVDQTIVATENKIEKVYTCNFDISNEKLGVPNIKLIGIGGAGNNIISFIEKKRSWPLNINTWLMNTDKKTLMRLKNLQIASSYFLIGEKKLHGYGSGGDPEVGKMAFEENANDVKEILKDTDILFLFAGLGKGTGSGVTPEIAKIAKQMGILTIAVVTLPSIDVEGQKTYENADNSYKILVESCDSICTISNDKIIKTGTSFFEQFELANNEICQIFSDFTDIVMNAGEINIDFHDLESFLKKNKYFFHALIKLGKELDSSKMKEMIIQTINKSYSNISLINEDIEIIANFKISHSASSDIITMTRKILKDTYASHRPDIKFIYGIEYCEVDEYEVSLFVSNSIQNIQTVHETHDISVSHNESTTTQPSQNVTKKVFNLGLDDDEEQPNEEDIITKMLRELNE